MQFWYWKYNKSHQYSLDYTENRDDFTKWIKEEWKNYFKTPYQ